LVGRLLPSPSLPLPFPLPLVFPTPPSLSPPSLPSLSHPPHPYPLEVSPYIAARGSGGALPRYAKDNITECNCNALVNLKPK